MGVKEGTERLAALTPETLKARTFDALRQLSISGSKRQTLILAIEDFHWIDKISEEYLVSLVESLSSTSILLICTYRPGYRPPWMDKSSATQMSLRPLSAPDSLRVVHSVSNAQCLPEMLARLIVAKAEGNPLFLEELAREISNRADGSATLSIPDTVEGVLQARIDRLADAPKRLLQVASVIGREVPLKLLQAICETPNLHVHLLDLKRQEFLYQRTEVGEQIYVFKHALTQDVTHDSLLTSTRQSLHEGTAQALEAIYQDRLEDHYEKLAHHYAHTANHEKALEYLELANRKATTSNAMQEAATYFEKAIALLDIMPDTESNRHRRIRLIVNQWIVFWLLLRIPDYYDLLVRHQVMAVALGDSELLATFYLHLGHCQWVFGLLHESADTLTDAVRFNEAAGVSEKSGPAYSMLQWCNHYLGNYDEALSWREAAMQRLRQPFDLRWTVWSLGSASWTYSCLGRGREAIEEARKEVALAEEYGDDSLVAFAHWILSLAHTYNGDFAKAIGHAEVAVEKAPTLADRVWAQTHLGFARCRGGRAREGAELLAPLIPMYEATRFVLGQVFAGTYLGEAYWRAGQLDDAERSLQEALELATRAGMRFYVGSIHRLLGEIAVSRDPAQAAEPSAASHFEASISVLREIRAENELALAYADYGRLRMSQGRVGQAAGHFSHALTLFERLGAANEGDKVRTELASIAIDPRGIDSKHPAEPHIATATANQRAY
jgi:tetratricopeptide (TPR) repeat protein